MKLKLSRNTSAKLKIKRRYIYVASFVAIASIIGVITFFYSNLGVTHTAKAFAPTNISGVINSYFRVTAINIASRRFDVDNLSGSIADFAVGKKIVIYQAKGATITSTNTSAYGTVTAYNNAGNYEFATITKLQGTGPTYTITVASLVNSYTETDYVQIVSDPQYADVNVTGTVTPIAWSATQGRGGIIVFEAAGTLSLGANIDASNMGFAGGVIGGSDGSCPDPSTYVSTSTNFAAKGEGMAAFASSQYYARGPQANGGGGGNPHNAGGGGGSNYTSGGNGGQGYQPGGSCAVQNAGGLAGKVYPYSSSTTKIFFGGGGGAGQENNGLASNGGAGGGIIIIRAKTLTSTCAATYGVYANGQSVGNNGGNDGAGGGGSGGTIIFDVPNYTLTCNIQSSANGGTGGNVTDAGSHGGGAGGGIGVIFEVSPPTNSKKVYASTAGANGKDCSSCTGTTGTSPSSVSTSKISITGPLPGQLSALPIELVSFTAEQTESGIVQLKWVTASEHNNDFFTVERSGNGKEFKEILKVKGAGESKEIKEYLATDNAVISTTTYYKLKQTDYDGKFAYSRVVYLDTKPVTLDVKMYPNPATDKFNIVTPEEGTLSIAIHNDRGAIIYEKEVDEQAVEIDVTNWTNGIYVVNVAQSGKKNTLKLVVKH